MDLRLLVVLLTYLVFPTFAISTENCYRTKSPHRSSCALPNLWAMREKLCSSDDSWGEGFRFLSGHGLNLRMKDNCTVDNAPLGIDLVMTISSTVKNRTDCWNRTKSIITRCVENGFPEFNGGEWWDLDGEDDPKSDGGNGKTFIYLQYLHISPPAEPDPCYVWPLPDYCPPYFEDSVKKRDETIKATKKGTFVDLDIDGNILRKRIIS
ncbi:hypothetical protein B0J11DRAFT_507787 [Dendryphion nanum]|uniref:Uncharacterized protein n=1 Tax=Dendryphion nanum TaxID=256645 RepID=A0A9P9DLC8_9PLEO|nr:hypothetical protein B0J11DRAFT_507787 [Dendryphion nanum]